MTVAFFYLNVNFRIIGPLILFVLFLNVNDRVIGPYNFTYNYS